MPLAEILVLHEGQSEANRSCLAIQQVWPCARDQQRSFMRWRKEWIWGTLIKPSLASVSLKAKSEFGVELKPHPSLMASLCFPRFFFLPIGSFSMGGSHPRLRVARCLKTQGPQSHFLWHPRDTKCGYLFQRTSKQCGVPFGFPSKPTSKKGNTPKWHTQTRKARLWARCAPAELPSAAIESSACNSEVRRPETR